jgi:hypothetical protein
MGNKYTITFTRNGNCDYKFDRETDSLFLALWYLVTLSIKYPIIDFKIRRGYIPCEKCDADWCGDSPMFDREGE